MKRYFASAAAALALSAATLTSASADTILGGEIAVGGWNQDPSGWVKYPNYVPDDQSKVDVDNDLNIDTQTNLYIRAKLEHPVPILPNLKVEYVNTSLDGNGRIDRDITFGDITISAGEDVYSELQLETVDATFYYELIDTGIDLDLGLTARYLDGYAKVQSKTTGLSDSTDFSFIVPMVYAGVRIPVPFLEGLSIGAEGNGIGYDGNAIYDIQGDLRYTFAMGLGVEAGYRYEKVKIDDIDDVDADVEIKGFYFGAIWDF